MKHWIEQYRLLYTDWWTKTAAELDGQELDDFKAFERADDLRPLDDFELAKMKAISQIFRPMFALFTKPMGPVT